MRAATTTTRAQWAIRIIVLSLLSQLAISWNVWAPGIREFPEVPAVAALPIDWGLGGGRVLLLLWLGALITLFIKPHLRWLAGLAIACGFLLVMEDLSRLQPWLYLYAWMLAGAALFGTKRGPEALLFTMRIVLSATYFWSGLQKLNYGFGVEIFPWLWDFAGLTNFLDEHTWLAYPIALIEPIAGVAVWFRPTRKVALVMLVGMHIFILMALGPLGHSWNEVIWPWNAAFAVLLFFVFPWRGEELNWPGWKQVWRWRFPAVVMLFTAIFPVLDFFGAWDHFLSGGLYSGHAPEAAFYYDRSDALSLPPSSDGFRMRVENSEEDILLMDFWALDELNVPLYPEERAHLEVGRQLCDCLNRPDLAGLKLNLKSRWKEEAEVVLIPCSELQEKRDYERTLALRTP